MNIEKIPAKKPIVIKRKKVAAYVRVSTSSDTQLHSLRAQIEYYKNKIKYRGDWDFAGVFIDDGLTGTKTNRPGLEDLFKACRDGKINLIITKSISRFARNTVDLLSIVRSLKELRIAIYFERENINTLTADGELMLTLLASFAQEEAVSASKNQKWSIRKRFEKGTLVGMAHLYGYDIVNGKPVINKHEAEIVRMVYEDYLSGMQSSEIAKKLNKMGEPRKTGGCWKSKDVLELIKNEKHTGNAILNKRYTVDPLSKKTKRNYGERTQYLVENSHEAIITKELFDAVQKERRRRAPRKNHVSHHGKPYNQLLICGACGSTFNRKKTPVRVFWRCARNLGNRTGNCDMKGIPEEILEDILAKILNTSFLDAEEVISKIEKITVTKPNEISILMKDGLKLKRTWKERSRAESWTEEMKEKARRKTKERICQKRK